MRCLVHGLLSAACVAMFSACGSFTAAANETNIVNGHIWVCTDDGLCMDMGPVPASETRPPAAETPAPAPAPAPSSSRLIQGYLSPGELIAFLDGREPESLVGRSLWLVLLLALVGGFLMNLTPCVLPMAPVNLMVIGRSAKRGALYGLGMMLAYGLLGVLASLFGLSFGAIQGNPWFNSAIAAVFAVLAVALWGAFAIDLSKGRSGLARLRTGLWPGFFAFLMGAVSAVLAGACVAPVLIAVLVYSSAVAETNIVLATALPFVLGLGMALPWPLAGAGLKVLPKPGRWMDLVNKCFAAVVLGLAVYYGYLAYLGFSASSHPADSTTAGTAGHLVARPATIAALLESAKRPVFVDCWAKWCKNCLAMEETTFRDEAAKKRLEGYTVIRLEVTDDMEELKKVPGFESIVGLPAYIVFE